MAQLEVTWLIWRWQVSFRVAWLVRRCHGSFGDVVTHLEIMWLTWRGRGSIGDGMAHLEMTCAVSHRVSVQRKKSKQKL